MKRIKNISMMAISVLLILIVTFSLPLQVAAQNITVETSGNNSADISSGSEVDTVDQGNIIGEDTTKRDEYTKYFITDEVKNQLCRRHY